MDCYGVIGYPIKHSVSPAMHNAAFRRLGIDAIYLAFEVRPESLRDAVFGAKALGIRGLNVTIPHKEEILKFVKPVGIAAKIGAVNTVVVDRLEGHNTDAYGAMKALENAGVGVEGKTALLVGAGGAARAIAFALVENGATVIVTNRTESKGLKLVEDVRKSGECIFYPYDRLEELKGKIDIIINATPLGMKGFESKLPVPEGLVDDVVVFDTVYNPMETLLISLAKRRGCRVVYGIDMLVFQGAEAFRLWLDVDPPVDVMKKAAIDALKLK
ncbi:shikimate dehydrogenase [Archaeoglobus veneficus]|uniref:Shikimate dehydrogenase (NADP(+)) n=1 Tax=Archaeoglobus veneficus (strain DSM 11195 / SNP6) TaxID=693661 RepID=F2KNA3_ARCVS|nr:shikimate dehydrogenase [Archaeoglobus veneficus]AEA46204.1 Shikimate dehydrogenase [Archaeoglobus veneficus SNP6]